MVSWYEVALGLATCILYLTLIGGLQLFNIYIYGLRQIFHNFKVEGDLRALTGHAMCPPFRVPHVHAHLTSAGLTKSSAPEPVSVLPLVATVFWITKPRDRVGIMQQPTLRLQRHPEASGAWVLDTPFKEE